MERVGGVLAHETHAALVHEDVGNLGVGVVGVAPGSKQQVNGTAEAAHISAGLDAHDDAVARVGRGRGNSLGLEIPVLLGVVLLSKFLVVLDAAHGEHDTLGCLVVLAVGGLHAGNAVIAHDQVRSGGTRHNLAACLAHGSLGIRGPHNAAGLGGIGGVGDKVDAVGHVGGVGVGSRIAAEDLGVGDTKAIGHPLQVVGSVVGHHAHQVGVDEALAVLHPEGVVLVGGVVIDAVDAQLLLPGSTRSLNGALGRGRRAAARIALLEHEHLFGALLKCGVSSSQTRATATADDDVVRTVPGNLISTGQRHGAGNTRGTGCQCGTSDKATTAQINVLHCRHTMSPL